MRATFFLLDRSSYHTSIRYFLMLVVMLLMGSCGSISDRPAPSPSNLPATSNQPFKEFNVIDVAVIPALSPKEQEKQLEALTDYLEKSVGYPINFQVAQNYEQAVDLLVRGEVEVAYLGPLTYVQARQQNPEIEPIVAPIEKSTGRPWYTSVIVANTAQGIRKLSDLKGKRFAFVSRSSTSGYLVPISHFREIGLNPDQDFTEVKYSGTHDKAEADLAAGVVDAIADSRPSFVKRQKAGKLDPKQYQIIWESAPIPMSPIVVSKQLAPEIVSDLKKALINAPEGLADVTGAESAGYTLVEDADYEPIRQLQKNLEVNSGPRQ
ncbi:MAG: phosphate/phosphite/phosphonate ABC transporter substrate-binding protein [Trichocoleus desertorum ATA4-8-CV12]|jgi:phosphonate transport system substrate-binding protein|nr:phosphate/phosphite/phosphonate ABC transporter substrate-binding protein [Trichocoleus desertorum ATA4-8-CV12]